jgi:hypothetical protein
MLAIRLARVAAAPAALLAAAMLAPDETLTGAGLAAAAASAVWLLGLRRVPHDRAALVEKIWSLSGSPPAEGVLARDGGPGFRSRLLRGGLHAGLWRWQYRLHLVPLVRIGEARIGYVVARDGEARPRGQALGRVVEGGFLDARAFLAGGGQRGRQRGVLREGLHAVNLAVFTVLTEDGVFAGPGAKDEAERHESLRRDLREIGGFAPVVIGRGGSDPAADEDGADADAAGAAVGIVTVHDEVGEERSGVLDFRVRARGRRRGHDDYQDPEAFFALGGRPGRQAHVLRDGTYYINRWFATVEIRSAERGEDPVEAIPPATRAPGVVGLFELLPGRGRRGTPRRIGWMPKILRNDLRSRPCGGRGERGSAFRVGRDGASDRPVDDLAVEHGENVLRLVKRLGSPTRIP